MWLSAMTFDSLDDDDVWWAEVVFLELVFDNKKLVQEQSVIRNVQRSL